MGVPTAGSRQLFEQRFGVLHVGGIEALGEPAIHRCEQLACLALPALLAPKPREAHRGAQLKRFRLLFSRNRNRLAVELLSGAPVVIRPCCHEVALDTQQSSPPEGLAERIANRCGIA